MFLEEEAHWWYAGMRRIVAALLSHGLLPKNPRVLDAGCGTGYNLRWLRENYASSVVGLDCSPLALEFCRSRGERELVRASIADLPLASGSFDLVISFEVVTQLREGTDRERSLGELRRVLRPGGILLVRVAAF